MSYSRSKNAILNIFFGYITQIGILVLSFIGRKIFLQYLSVDYLGINGLYSNILTVLSLAELGLGSAVTFSLYKPIAENNLPMIHSLLRYFKKIYLFLALAVLAVGMASIPLLRYIVNSNLPQSDLIIYYILFLLNTVSSYFMAHKVALLSAYQEHRIQRIVALFITLLRQVFQITVLIIWKSYYVYIVIMVFGTIINSITLNYVCDRIHPEINKMEQSVDFDKLQIFKLLKASIIYKISAVAVNNTDNILISIIVNTAAVGFYSNYLIVVNSIQGFIATITNSLISGIGNLGANGDKIRQYEIFNFILLFYHFIAAVGGVGFFLLFNDLIAIWLGPKYVFNQTVVFAIAFNFYLSNAISPVFMYREANGLFEEVKYLLLITALINIILSIIFGSAFGVYGILIATAISRIVTQVWYEPKILFKKVFNMKANEYWKRQAKYLILSCVAFGLSLIATIALPHTLIYLFAKTAIIVVISIIVFLLFTWKSPELCLLKNILMTRGRKNTVR